MKLPRFFRQRVRLRYWKHRALSAERQAVAAKSLYEARLAELEANADAERWRNVEREDIFVSAAVLGARGIVGIPPRTGPALKQQQPVPVIPTDPWSAVSGSQRMEFDMYWLPDAKAMGMSEMQARQAYLQELEQRRTTLIDENYNQ